MAILVLRRCVISLDHDILVIDVIVAYQIPWYFIDKNRVMLRVVTLMVVEVSITRSKYRTMQ